MKATIEEEFKRMLVAVDGSDDGCPSAKVAVALAKKFGAELIVCHVIPTPTYSLPKQACSEQGTVARLL